MFKWLYPTRALLLILGSKFIKIRQYKIFFLPPGFFKMSQLLKRSLCPKFHIQSKSDWLISCFFLPTLRRVFLFLFPIVDKPWSLSAASGWAESVSVLESGWRRRSRAQRRRFQSGLVNLHACFLFVSSGVAALWAWEEVCLSESWQWMSLCCWFECLCSAAQLSQKHLLGGARHGNSHIAGMFCSLSANTLAAAPSSLYEAFPANPLLPWDSATSLAVYVWRWTGWSCPAGNFEGEFMLRFLQ